MAPGSHFRSPFFSDSDSDSEDQLDPQAYQKKRLAEMTTQVMTCSIQTAPATANTGTSNGTASMATLAPSVHSGSGDVAMTDAPAIASTDTAAVVPYSVPLPSTPVPSSYPLIRRAAPAGFEALAASPSLHSLPAYISDIPGDEAFPTEADSEEWLAKEGLVHLMRETYAPYGFSGPQIDFLAAQPDAFHIASLPESLHWMLTLVFIDEYVFSLLRFWSPDYQMFKQLLSGPLDRVWFAISNMDKITQVVNAEYHGIVAQFHRKFPSARFPGEQLLDREDWWSEGPALRCLYKIFIERVLSEIVLLNHERIGHMHYNAKAHAQAAAGPCGPGCTQDHREFSIRGLMSVLPVSDPERDRERLSIQYVTNLKDTVKQYVQHTVTSSTSS